MAEKKITFTQAELDAYIDAKVNASTERKFKTLADITSTKKVETRGLPPITIVSNTIEESGLIKQNDSVLFAPHHKNGRTFKFKLDYKFMITHREYHDELAPYWIKKYEELYVTKGGSLRKGNRIQLDAESVKKLCKLGFVSVNHLRCVSLSTLQTVLNSVYGKGSVYAQNYEYFIKVMRRF